MAALTKHHEKIADRNRDNHAAYVDQFDYPRGASERSAASPGLNLKNVKSLARKLESDPPHVTREWLLSDTAQRSSAYFKVLGKISPAALACLDALMPARLRYRSYSADCPTLEEAVDEWIRLPDDRPPLQEAVLEWHRMPADARAQASLNVKVLRFGP
jgi:hypothetical protein